MLGVLRALHCVCGGYRGMLSRLALFVGIFRGIFLRSELGYTYLLEKIFSN